MIQDIIIVYYTNFEASRFYSTWEIVDETFNIGLSGEKKNGMTESK